MFTCLVAPTGQVVNSGAYRGTRGSELLEQELLKTPGHRQVHPSGSQSPASHRRFLWDGEIRSRER